MTHGTKPNQVNVAMKIEELVTISTPTYTMMDEIVAVQVTSVSYVGQTTTILSIIVFDPL